MSYLKYSISKQESITRWKTCNKTKTSFESPEKAFYAPVNMEEGYVQIVYPVREAFLSNHSLENVKLYTGSFDNIVFPFENNRVDFSGFEHTPHYLSTNARSWIEVPADGIYPFDVFTCGGIKIWIDGEAIDIFTPYTRNIPGKKNINLSLDKGIHVIDVFADELAERDYFFYFEFRYQGDTPIVGVLESEDIDAEELSYKEAFLKSCYFERDQYEKDDVYLIYDNTLLEEEIELNITTGTDSGSWLKNASFQAVKDKNSVLLAKTEETTVGVYDIYLSCKVGIHDVKRKFLVALLPEQKLKLEAGNSIQKRKKIAKQFIVDNGEEHVIRAMVILDQKKEMTPLALKFIQNSINKIRRKEDCADFVLVPIFILITRYRKYLSDDLYEEIKKIILDFRYWIDEPGNDVMWYFSENHAFLFHIAQYLAGYFFPEETFSVSQNNGNIQYEKGKERVKDWFKLFFRYHYAEWNSATYLPIDFIGFFTLYEMAPDEDIRALAEEALDYTFELIHVNTFKGIMTCSYGRAYENTLKARSQVEPCFLSWIAYNEGNPTSRNRATALFCLSSYEPKAKCDTTLKDREYIEVSACQGMNHVFTYLFRTANYSIGATQGFKPFQHGHQQHLMDISFGSDCRQFYINHPGERTFSGENRPSYWAGNGTIPLVFQEKNLVLMVFDIDKEELVHAIHTYSPFIEYEESVNQGKYLFIKNKGAYLCIWFSEGFEITEHGANTRKEVISKGLKHGVCVRVADESEYKDFSSFMNAMTALSPAFDKANLSLSCKDPKWGTFEIKEQKAFLNGTHLHHNYEADIKTEKGCF